MQLILKVKKPTVPTYFEKKFWNPVLEWKNVYTILRRVIINTNLCIFQFNLLHILYFNEMCYKFGKDFSFIPILLFFPWRVWKLNSSFSFLYKNQLFLDAITPQSTFFGFTDHKANDHLINHMLLIFKYYVYKTTQNGSVDLKDLEINIHKIKNIVKQISLNKPEKRKTFEQKWKSLLENK